MQAFMCKVQKVMKSEFGNSWQTAFDVFEDVPIAAASIGQVHAATLAGSDGLAVAVKIQFPGVVQSIDSDLSNLGMLLSASSLLPRGLYLRNTLAVMKRELEDECDYIREARSGRIFRALLSDDDVFEVPRVIPHLSTSRVLTTERMWGVPMSQSENFSQDLRNQVLRPGSKLIQWSLTHSLIDWASTAQVVPEGSVPFWVHADRPKLDQLSVERKYSKGSVMTTIIRSCSHSSQDRIDRLRSLARV